MELANRCNWTIPAWEWQRLDEEDEEASLWIERVETINLLAVRKRNIDAVQADIDRSLGIDG